MVIYHDISVVNGIVGDITMVILGDYKLIEMKNNHGL